MTPPRTHQARTSASNVTEKLCLGAHLSAAGGVSKAIDGAIALELESLQLFTKNNNRWQSKPLDPKEIERFHQRHEQWGAHRQIFSHGSYLVNLAKVQAKQRAKVQVGGEWLPVGETHLGVLDELPEH